MNDQAAPPTAAKARAAPIQTRRALFKFFALFALFYLAFQGIAHLSWYEETILHPNLRFNAAIASDVLALLGQGTSADRTDIFSDEFSVSVREGCDALQATLLFAAVVLAFPAPFTRKLWGLAGGFLLFQGFNVIRITVLFLTGVYFPRLFQLMHMDVMQALFIALAFVVFLLWAIWVTRRKPG